MSTEFITGIDIGTHSIKIVVSEITEGVQLPSIIHASEHPSHGFRHGYVVDPDLATKSLLSAVIKASKTSKQKIDSAKFSIGGAGLDSHYVRTSIDISKKEAEIGPSHIDELIRKAEELFSTKYPNKKIIHIIPFRYSVDHRDVLGSPVGMYGTLIEVKILFVTILEHHHDAFIQLIEKAGIEIDDIIASPIADAQASLNHKQKTQGCLLTNIGSETSSFASFENGILSSLKTIQIGSNDITNDIALCMKISLDDAEEVKIGKNKEHPRKKTEEIIHARVTDILEKAESHLKSIHKHRLLPAGNILSGGGSQLEFLEEYSKKQLHLPTELVQIYKQNKKTKRNINIGSRFSTAYGLCFPEKSNQSFKKKISLKRIKKIFSNILNQITP